MEAGAETRFKALDGLRGLAVLQVVLYHYFLLMPIQADWYQCLQRLGNGIDGLTVFFVLSGFLIGGILLKHRTDPAMIRVFFWRRVCRILPLYFLLLASYGLLRLVDQHWRFGFLYYWYSDVPFWYYLVFLQNERMVRDGVLGAAWLMVTWSLAVEMQFYLIAPWVVRYVSNRSLGLLGVCCIAAGPFLHSGRQEDLLTDRLDALVAGVGLALLLRNPAGRAFFARNRKLLRVLAVTYLIALAVLLAASGPVAVLRHTTTAALAWAVWIALLTDDTAWPGVRPALELLYPVGLGSYFIYLFHMPVYYTLAVLFPAGILLALPLTFALAAVSYRYFERPLIRWGHRWSYQPATARRSLPAKTGS